MKYTHGGDIYRNRVKWDFSANIGPFGMPKAVEEAAMRGILASTAYPDSEAEELNLRNCPTGRRMSGSDCMRKWSRRGDLSFGCCTETKTCFAFSPYIFRI